MTTTASAIYEPPRLDFAVLRLERKLEVGRLLELPQAPMPIGGPLCALGFPALPIGSPEGDTFDSSFSKFVEVICHQPKIVLPQCYQASLLNRKHILASFEMTYPVLTPFRDNYYVEADFIMVNGFLGGMQ